MQPETSSPFEDSHQKNHSRQPQARKGMQWARRRLKIRGEDDKVQQGPMRLPILNLRTSSSSPTRTSKDRSPTRQRVVPEVKSYFIIYPPQLSSQVSNIFYGLSKIYATLKVLEYGPQLDKEMSRYFNEIKLTKRVITFVVLNGPKNPQLLPAGSRHLVLTEKPQNDTEIRIGEGLSDKEVQSELIRSLQLDSVWVGILCRIGTDLADFIEYLNKEENFHLFEVGVIDEFLTQFEDEVKTNQRVEKNMFKMCFERATSPNNLEFFEHQIEEMVRSSFNQRVVFTDITSNSYLNLLNSRGFFNLVFFEQDIITRFHSFRRSIQAKYPWLHQQMSLDVFILLDDFMHAHFIFPALSKVKKFINRSVETEPYPQLIRRLHKQIIPEFRLSQHEYYLNICKVLKSRAACLKESVGAIIVDKRRSILSTGYNGTPMGTIECYNGGCEVCNNSQKIGTEVLSCRCIHAEYNCILTAGINNTPGCTLYSSKIPCLWCCKLIIQGRIKRVICLPSKYELLEYENIEKIKHTLQGAKIELTQVDLRDSY